MTEAGKLDLFEENHKLVSLSRLKISYKYAGQDSQNSIKECFLYQHRSKDGVRPSQSTSAPAKRQRGGETRKKADKFVAGMLWLYFADYISSYNTLYPIQQGLAHHQPKPFSRTTSLSKFPNKSTSQYPVAQAASDSQPTDDDDWVSSSSAVASPAPEPEDEEEDEPIYVNQNISSRAAHRGSPPATPTRTTTNLPHRRHHPSQAVPPAAEAGAVPAGGTTSNAKGGSTGHHQNQAATESDHIHFARAPADLATPTHHQDPRIHQNGNIHHVSPPPGVLHDEPIEMEPSSSIVRIASEPECEYKRSYKWQEWPTFARRRKFEQTIERSIAAGSD
jgi:hypothetical protein